MRRPIHLLLATALAAPLATTPPPAARAPAAPGTTCARTTGAASFAPGLWKLQPPAQADLHESPQSIKTSGRTIGCVGGGVTSGTLAGAIAIADPANCNSLLAGDDGVPPTAGTISIAWGPGRSSRVSVTLRSVRSRPTQTDIAGTVSPTSTMFRSLHVAVRVNLTPEPGGCTTKTLQGVMFKEVTPLRVG